MTNWRLVQDGAGDASHNMACDEAIFEAVAANQSGPILRLYEWERPSISVGRFQSIERTINTANCERLHIPIVRRITGGRGILHGHDLTVSIAGISEVGTDTLAIYNWLSEGFILAFQQIGITAERGQRSRQRSSDTRGDCFACISQADIVNSKTGGKLLGAALHLRERSFLMQASIPLCRNSVQNSVVTPENVFIGDASAMDCTLKGVTRLQMRQAVVSGFTLSLNFTFSEVQPVKAVDSPCAL